MRSFILLFSFLSFVFSNLWSQNNERHLYQTPHVDSVFKSIDYVSKNLNHFRLRKIEKLTKRSDYAFLYIEAFRLWQDGRFSESNDLINQWLPKIPKDENLVICHFFFLKGKNHFDAYEDKEAVTELIKADNLSSQINNPDLSLSICQYRAGVYLAINNKLLAKKVLDLGKKYYSLSRDNYNKGKYILTYSSLLNQLAISEGKKEYATRATQLLDSTAIENWLPEKSQINGLLIAELGLSYSILGDHQKALDLYMKSADIFSNGHEQQFDNLQITIFHEYYNLRNYPKVIETGEQILTWIDSKDAVKSRKKEIHQRLAEVYEKNGDIKKALYHTHKLLAEVESQNRIQYSKDLAELEEKFQSEKKQRDLEISQLERKSLEKEKASKAVQLKYSTLVIFVISILLTISIITSYRFNLSKKRLLFQSKELEEVNTQLEKEITQKNFLFKELHHRVKNNFQLIIAFMRLEQRFADEMDTGEFIRHLELKLNSMSMVHEMLYQDANIEKIELKRYLKQLTEAVASSIGNESCDIEFDISGDQVDLNIDVAIPIGLAINELITNSVKHAQRDELELKISVLRTGSNFLLTVKDNGIGFPEDFNPERSDTLGIRVIRLLIEQINGTVSWRNDNGANWFLSIPIK